MKNRHIGSDFDDFLREDGSLADAEAIAIERVVALQLTAMVDEQPNLEVRDGSASANELAD